MTSRHAHNETITEALADLTPRQEQAFYHVLGCDPCRDRMRSVLKTRIDDLEETFDENPAFRWLLGQVPAMLSAGGRAENEEKVQAFLQDHAQGRGNGDALSAMEPREVANAVLLRLPELPPAIVLSLCDFLDELLGSRAFPYQEGNAFLQVRSVAARANAQRALGQWDGAEASFRHALAFLSLYPWPTLAGAELLRGQGVLAWERGELDVAEAFLRQSARVRAEIGDLEDEAESWVLLGLIVAERGAMENAVRLLRLGRKDLSRRLPWLSLQARYENARLAALLGLSRAREVLEEAMTPEEAAVVTESRAQWLKGRAHAALGDLEAAEGILEGARVRLLAEKAFAPAALCTADLAFLLLDQGRADEIEHNLLADLMARFAGEPLLPRLQTWTLSQLPKVRRRPLDEDKKFEAGAILRRLLRMEGHSVLVEIP